MNVASSLLLAWRFLTGGSTRSTRAIARIRGGIIGVGLSLIPLVVVLEVADGMIEGITERFIEAGSYHLQAIARDEPDTEEIASDVSSVASIAGVTSVTPERQGLGLAAAGSRRTAVTIRAVDPGLWENDAGLRKYVEMVDGEWLLDPNGIVLGQYVARDLHVGVGDEVRVLTARALPGGRVLPRTRAFTVRGIVSSGYADLDRLWSFIAFDVGNRLMPAESSRLLIGIKVDDPFALENPLFRAPSRAAAGNAARIVNAVHDDLTTRYRVVTWFDSERAKYMSFATTKDLLVFIMVLIVIVAAVNISSTLVMLVLQKQEEIAIIKSFGVSPRGVVTAFVIAGAILGVLGTVVGLAFGLLLAVNINEVLSAVEWLINGAIAIADVFVRLAGGAGIASIHILSPEYYLQQIPISLRFRDIALIATLTILLATVAAWFPARRAGRIRPLEVLRRH